MAYDLTATVLPPTSIFDIVEQYNRIREITFGATHFGCGMYIYLYPKVDMPLNKETKPITRKFFAKLLTAQLNK